MNSVIIPHHGAIQYFLSMERKTNVPPTDYTDGICRLF